MPAAVANLLHLHISNAVNMSHTDTKAALCQSVALVLFFQEIRLFFPPSLTVTAKIDKNTGTERGGRDDATETSSYNRTEVVTVMCQKYLETPKRIFQTHFSSLCQVFHHQELRTQQQNITFLFNFIQTQESSRFQPLQSESVFC